MADETVSAFRWAQFIVGAVFFAALLYAHIFIREMSYFLLAVPGLLMGVDPVKIINAVLPGAKK